jgi:GH25 family lysozyme M1 (1,4-beta-N-acetylmuramidase)
LKRLGSNDYFPHMNKLRRVTILRAVAAGGVAVALSCALAPDAHATSAGAVQPVRGLDISAYQHTGSPINWHQLARDGLRFVSIKASEATYYLNPYYAADAHSAAAAGLAVLPYVFANPAVAGGAPTARFAVRAAGIKHGSGRPPLVVDLENDPYRKNTDCYGIGVKKMTGWVAGFIRQVHTLTGRWPVIYTTAAWWQECTHSTTQFRNDPLWLAAFGRSPGSVPAPWQRWAFWQYADNGSLPGIGPVDLDYYRPTDGLPSLSPVRKPIEKKPAKKKPAQAKKHPPARAAQKARKRR